MPELLIELFSEEIPARMQAKAAGDLRSLITSGLVDAGTSFLGVPISAFGIQHGTGVARRKIPALLL